MTTGKIWPARGGLPGQVKGRVVDSSGAVLPGVTIVLHAAGTRRTAVTASDGTYLFSGVPPRTLSLQATLEGFGSGIATVARTEEARQVDFELRVGSVTEAITVLGESPRVDVQTTRRQIQTQDLPSANVVNLQRRAAGVLAVRIEVPRAGTAHRFVKPLVIDQEAFVTLRYTQR